jgi:xylan 1,4-beta-xylosidase
MIRPVLALYAISILAVNPVRADADDTAALRKITVDTTVTFRNLRPLSGVAGVPAAQFARDAHIDWVRTGMDARIFPDVNADPENAKSYDFAQADRSVGAIKSMGAEPLFVLGENLCAARDSAVDADKCALIVRHLVLHYHRTIRYWEIWNEPDLKSSWAGSAGRYYELYEKTARAIRAADDSAFVGGPAIYGALNAGAYREDFIDYVRLHRLPLDFFSWHIVDTNDPYDFVSAARILRSILDARGFGSAKNVLDGWNADLSNRDMSAAARAAFAASSLIYMLGGPVDAQTYAWSDGGFRGGAAPPDPAGHALIAFGSMKATPILVQTEGGDEAGLAVLAGRSPDRRSVQILISNYEIPAQYREIRANGDKVAYHDNGGYDATVVLGAPGKYRVKRFRISDSANFTLVDQSVQSGPNIHLQAALPPPAVEFIEISGP